MDFLTEIGIQRYRLRHQSRRPLQEQPDDQQAGLGNVPTSQEHVPTSQELVPTNEAHVPTSKKLAPSSADQALADDLSAARPARSEGLNTRRPEAEQGPLTRNEISSHALTDFSGDAKGVDADAPDSWTKIIEDMQDAQRCAACAAATPILGEGNQSADWVFIIDAPSLNDSREQQLLSGRPGTLFKAILQALNLSLEAVYLTSVFKCPPAEDFRLTPGCGELLERQLNLIRPQKVVVFGEFAAQTLLRRNDALTELRESVARLNHLSSAVMPTFSLAQMLEQPRLKADVWRDLRLLLAHEELAEKG